MIHRSRSFVITGFPSPDPELEVEDFSETRDYFVALFCKHLPDADPAPSRDTIDAAVLLFINLALTAKSEGRADPHPWFSDACAFALQNDIDVIEHEANGTKPVIN